MLPITYIEARDIPDAWFQCVSKVQEVGFKYVIQHGSYIGQTRLEFDWVTVQITHPYAEPYDNMLPDIPPELGIPAPVDYGYIEKYLPYLMDETKATKEQYTYGERIGAQREYWISKLRETPNTNQAVLQVGQPTDWLLDDPPCLRHIDMRIRDNKLVFYPYFRSWDLWGGFPANLAGTAVLHKYMADEIGVETGPIIASSKGLHLYGYIETLAKLRCGKACTETAS